MSIFWVTRNCDKKDHYYYHYFTWFQRKVQKRLHQLNLMKAHPRLMKEVNTYNLASPN